MHSSRYARHPCFRWEREPCHERGATSMTYFPRTTSTRATLHPPGASAFSSTGLKSGYDKQEVDAFRSAVQDTFLGGAVFWVSTPPVRSDDLRGKQFSTHRPGYNKTQVAAFLEAAGLRLAAIEATDRPAGPLVSGALLVAWAEWADSTTFETAGFYDAAKV